jgi:hypothetical protein
MKTAIFTSCVGAMFVAACLTTSTAYAGKSPQLDLLKKELRATTAAEIPAKAAQLVSQAKPETRATMAEDVVSAVFIVRPAAVIAAVSAIARANPDVAAVAAAQASALLPKKAAVIARAAADAAPAQMAGINAAVSKAASPTAAPASAAPVSVAALPPPTVGAPFTPYPGSPNEINRNNTIEVPPGGGRNYAGP